MTVSRRTAFYQHRIPAGTPQSAPSTLALAIGDVWLHSITVRVPPGHNGLTAYAFSWNGIHLVPWGPGQSYVVTNDATNTYPIEEEIHNFALMKGFNTDIWAHTVYWAFDYVPITLTGPTIEARDILAIA
jgi:hypothetical protein